MIIWILASNKSHSVVDIFFGGNLHSSTCRGITQWYSQTKLRWKSYALAYTKYVALSRYSWYQKYTQLGECVAQHARWLYRCSILFFMIFRIFSIVLAQHMTQLIQIYSHSVLCCKCPMRMIRANKWIMRMSVCVCKIC